MKWKCPAFLLALLGPLAPLLASTRFALLYRDLGSLELFQKAFWRENVLELQLPLWNHWVLGGAPYLADPSSAFYYPLNAFFLLFPARLLPHALSWYFLLQLGLLLLGTMFFFRRLDLSAFWRATLTLSFGAGGAVFSLLYMPNFLDSLVCAIFFLGCWRRFAETGENRWLFLSSLCLALCAYAGDPQTAFLFGLFFAPLMLRKRFWAIPLLGALSLLAFSAQLIPSLGHLGGTVRDPRLGGLIDFEAWSLHPARLLEWIAPLPFGTEIYRHSQLTPYVNGPDPAPLLSSLYPGLLFLPLLIASLPFLRKSGEARRWFLLGVFFLVISFGSFSPLPLNAVLAKVLPLWGSFRHPERLVLFAQLCFTVVAALALAQDEEKIRVRLLYIFPAVAALSVFFSPLGKPALLFFALAIFLSLFRLRSPLRRGWEPALAFFVACDLAFTTGRIIFPVPALVATENFSPYLRLLRQEPDFHSPGRLPLRFFTGSESSLNWAVLDRIGYGLPSQGKLTLHQFLVLHLNTAAYFHLPASLGYSTVMDPRHQKLWNALAQNQFHRLMGLRGTKYLGEEKDGQYFVREIPFLPYFWAAPEVWYSGNEDLSRRLLSAPDWPWQKRMVVEADSPFAPAALKNPPLHFSLLRPSGSRVIAEMKSEAGYQSAWILWNETFSRNWSASMNGEKLETAPANGWATAIRLPSLEKNKTYNLMLEYEDPLVPLGQAFFALWVLIFAWSEYRRYRLPPSPLS